MLWLLLSQGLAAWVAGRHRLFRATDIGRLNRALWVNSRYLLITWRWGRIVAALLLMGWVMKLTLLSCC